MLDMVAEAIEPVLDYAAEDKMSSEEAIKFFEEMVAELQMVIEALRFGVVPHARVAQLVER